MSHVEGKFEDPLVAWESWHMGRAIFFPSRPILGSNSWNSIRFVKWMNGESGLPGRDEGGKGCVWSEGSSEVTGSNGGVGTMKSFPELRWDKKVGLPCLAPHLD